MEITENVTTNGSAEKSKDDVNCERSCGETQLSPHCTEGGGSDPIFGMSYCGSSNGKARDRKSKGSAGSLVVRTSHAVGGSRKQRGGDTRYSSPVAEFTM